MAKGATRQAVPRKRIAADSRAWAKDNWLLMVRTDWSRKLSETINTKGGKKLAKLSEARAFILALPAAVQRRNQWQHTAKLTIEAAAGGDVEAATDQLKLALFLDGKLDLSQ